jgi:hypothetical protein
MKKILFAIGALALGLSGYRPSARGLRHREVQQRILPHLG